MATVLPPIEHETAVRPMTSLDIPDLALITERANAAALDLPLPEDAMRQSAYYLEARMARPKFWGYVAVHSGRMAGYAAGYPASELNSLVNEPKAEYLSLLMVDPDFWGKRIASRLLDIVTLRAQFIGKKRILLWTGEENSHARAVYEHRGFVETKRSRDSAYGAQIQYQLDI